MSKSWRTGTRAAAALLALTVVASAGCSSTWQGLKSDAGGLFGDEPPSTLDVTEIQVLLNERGYDAGPADGVPGPRTAGAIRTYQADHGLDVNGVADEELIEHLRDSPPLPRRVRTVPPREDDWVDPY
jgi:hypothetical protein